MKDNSSHFSCVFAAVLFVEISVFHMLCFKWYQICIKNSLKKYTFKGRYRWLLIKVPDWIEKTNETINIIKGKLKTKTYTEGQDDSCPMKPLGRESNSQ